MGISYSCIGYQGAEAASTPQQQLDIRDIASCPEYNALVASASK